MKTTKLTAIFRAMLVTAFITCDLTATSEKTLSAFGHKLEARYAGQIEALKAAIAKALPAVDTGKNSAYQKAREVEQAAEADRNAKQAALDESRGHIGLLNHRKAWIGRAIKGVAEAKEQLKQAEAMTGIARSEMLGQVRTDLRSLTSPGTSPISTALKPAYSRPSKKALAAPIP